MYYVFEFICGEWVEIGCGTCVKAIEAHLAAAGIDDYWIVGGW